MTACGATAAVAGNPWEAEAATVDKSVCKNGGWELIGYRNQGECVASLVSHRP